ncbi:immunity-related GTPase family M protein isoform X1 [Fukomys damarensis]|uniref:immunity-related GTPase family M protein isoform X1 n=1 Tax=Fukomys damarensis TaxID=885580 RepID=UPI00054009ED|nr:immunity-related GTPase family M protein isoform X1 [Fukomys damarensis]XP_033617425.1 immunity-related GTPase family M protein isoform X1 [Fukomys damarensis]
MTSRKGRQHLVPLAPVRQLAPLLASMAEDAVTQHTPLSTSFTSVASYHKGCSISPEDSRRLDKAVREGKLLDVAAVVKQTVETVSRAPVSIAVAGDSGNGMSSFVNALREIGHEEKTSAPTGVVRTTLTPARYTSPRFPDVSLWDLPGMGASGQSLDAYLGELQFGQYDLFIIIASEQFSLNHVRLAKSIERVGKRFYVTWTKVDRDLSTTPLSKVLLLQSIRENILDSLRKEGLRDPPIFLVSSLEPSLHEFPTLRRKLQTDIYNLRCRGPLEALFRICEVTVNDKVASLQARVSPKYLQDTLGVADAEDLEQCLKAYRCHFGVDDESLQQVAWSTGRVVSEYRTELKSQVLPVLCRADLRLRIMTCRLAKVLLWLLGWAPWCGPRAIRFFALMRHRRVIHSVGEDTKAILRKILDDSKCPA